MSRSSSIIGRTSPLGGSGESKGKAGIPDPVAGSLDASHPLARLDEIVAACLDHVVIFSPATRV